MRVLDALGTVAGRISTGSAMAVAIAVGLWRGAEGDVDPVRLGAVVTTTLAWLAAEIASGRKPSEHDVALFNRIVEHLPEQTLDLLRAHDFHNSYHGKHADGIFGIAAFEGTRNQFLDRSLQKRWAKVHAQIRTFANELLVACGPVGAGPLFSAHPDIGDRDNPEPWVQERIDRLNKESAAANEAINAFERHARNRLRL